MTAYIYVRTYIGALYYNTGIKIRIPMYVWWTNEGSQTLAMSWQFSRYLYALYIHVHGMSCRCEITNRHNLPSKGFVGSEAFDQ